MALSGIFSRATPSAPLARRPCAGAWFPSAGDGLCVRFGGKTPPWRWASAWSFCSSRPRIHSRPSASTSSSISRKERGLSVSAFIRVPFVQGVRLLGEEPLTTPITHHLWCGCQIAPRMERNQKMEFAILRCFCKLVLEASVAQPGRASRCQRECRGFESLRSLHFHFCEQRDNTETNPIIYRRFFTFRPFTGCATLRHVLPLLA